MFWLVCALMTLATLAMILAPIVWPSNVGAKKPETALYKAQLAEVDRDVERQVIAVEDAERTRVEIARRLLAAARNGPQSPDESPKSRPVAIFSAIALATLAGGLYWGLGAPGYADLPLQLRIASAEEMRRDRPSQAAAEATARVLTEPDFDEGYLASVDQLRTMVPQRSGDLQGWELLAYHEARLRQFPAAAKAQAQIVKIKGEEATADDLLRQAELLVAAADGYVSPEAEVIVRQVIEVAPNSVAARYYMGAVFDQTDRPDLAFRLWRSILESGAPESVYVTLTRNQIADAAFRAGVIYTAPVPVVAHTEDLPGPTADQMRAAEEMNEDDRRAMIENMVSGLADRLASEGGTPAEWARLITAYSVLDKTEEAKTVLNEARDVYAESPDALGLLEDVARQAGLVE
ncbi:MAG: c-type cytochrome biogenesis protein CcmI [Pseudomonadota bacterium]